MKGAEGTARKNAVAEYLSQLYALCYKNSVLFRRNYVSSLCHLFAPALFVLAFSGFLYAVNIKTTDVEPEPIIQLVRGTEGGGLGKCKVYDRTGGRFGFGMEMKNMDCTTLLYAPSNAVTDALMGKLAEQNPDLTLNVDILGFADEADMSQHIQAGLKPVFAGLLFQPGLVVGVEDFSNLDLNGDTSNVLPYEIWYNKTVMDNSFLVNSGDDLLRLETSETSYVLKVQKAVGDALVALHTGESNAELKMNLKPFPYVYGENRNEQGSSASSSSQDPFALEAFGSLFYIIGVMIMFIVSLRMIVADKDNKTLDALRMMGLYESCYWLSWTIYFAFMCFFASLLMILAGLAVQVEMFVHSNFFFLWAVYFFYLFSMCCFAMFLSVFMPSTKVAIMVGFLIMAIAVLFQLFVTLPFGIISLMYDPYRLSPAALNLLNLYVPLVYAKIDRNIYGMTKARTVEISPGVTEEVVPGYLFDDAFDGPFQYYDVYTAPNINRSLAPGEPCNADNIASASVRCYRHEATCSYDGGNYQCIGGNCFYSCNKVCSTDWMLSASEGLCLAEGGMWLDFGGGNTACPCVYTLPSDFESIMRMVGASILYCFLAWYLGQVLTLGHGRAEPFWFIFTPWYWIPSINSGMQVTGPQPSPTVDKDEDVANEEQAIMNGTKSGGEYPVILRSIVKQFSRGFRAVDGVTLAMKKGELFVLLGHNGAGKTTLINCLSGMLSVSGGDCEIFGQSVQNNMSSIRHILGVCPQHDILFDELTASEHLRFYGFFQGMSSTEVSIQGTALLEQVKLDKLRGRRAGKYSGGMRRRLSMTIAALGNKRIVFLDEPTTGLDPQNQRHVWDMINDMKKDKVVILTTHLMEEADLLGDKIGIMSAGKLIALGNPLHLKRKFGGNYKVAIYPGPEANRIEIRDEVMKFIPKAQVPKAGLNPSSSGPVEFEVPEGDFGQAPALFNWIDKKKRDGVIKEWGLAQTSLEDVFNSTNDEHKPKDVAIEMQTMNPVATEVAAPNGTKQDDAEVMDADIVDFEDSVQFTSSFASQGRALFLKSLTLQKRQKKTLCCQIFIPLTMVILMFVMQFLLERELGSGGVDYERLYRNDPAYMECASCVRNQRFALLDLQNSNTQTPGTITQSIYTNSAQLVGDILTDMNQVEQGLEICGTVSNLDYQKDYCGSSVDYDVLFSEANELYSFCAYNASSFGAPSTCTDFEDARVLSSSFTLEAPTWFSSLVDGGVSPGSSYSFSSIRPEQNYGGFPGGERIMVGVKNPSTLGAIVGESCFDDSGILEERSGGSSEYTCTSTSFSSSGSGNLFPSSIFEGVDGFVTTSSSLGSGQTVYDCSITNATLRAELETSFAQRKSGLLQFFPTHVVMSNLENNVTYYSSPSYCQVTDYDSFTKFGLSPSLDHAKAINTISLRAQEGVQALSEEFGFRFPRTREGIAQARKLLTDFFPTAALIFEGVDLAQGNVEITWQSYYTDETTSCEYNGAYPFAQVELVPSSNGGGGSCNDDNVFRPNAKILGFSRYGSGFGGSFHVFHSANMALNALTSAMLGGTTPDSGSPIGSTLPHVTVGVRPMPYKNDEGSSNSVQAQLDAIYKFMGAMMVPLATSFLLPVLVFHIVHEKEHKLRAQMLMMGLKMKVYWIVQYLFDLFIVMTTLVLFYLIGSILQVKFFTNHQFGIILLLFFIWANAMIALAFLLSVFFSRTRNANIFLYLIVLFSVIASFVVNLIKFEETPFLPAPAWWIWMPQMAYYRAIYLLGLRSYYWEDLDSEDEMVQLWGILTLEAIIMFTLAAYLDIVIPKEFGMNRGPFFFIEDLFSCFFNNNKKKKMEMNLGDDDGKVIPENGQNDDDDDDEEDGGETPDGMGEDPDVVKERQLVMEGAGDVMSAPIRIKNLRKQFGAFVAVDGLYLHMKDKQCFALLGPNGAGKSTTISILTGLYGPTSGDAHVNGYSIRSQMHMVHQKIGVCPQHDIFYPELSVREHLLLYARLKGVSRSMEKALVNNALAAVQLTAHQHKRARQLSGGQRRRLSIAGSLIGNPGTVFLDEPTTGIDPTSRQGIHDIILKEKEKRCVILTTHLMSEAELLSDNIGIMAHGRLKTLGTAQNLKDKFSEGFKIVCVVNDADTAIEFVQKSIPGAVVESHVNQKITFRVEDQGVNIGEAFQIMQKSGKGSGIEDFGLRMTSLEEVFVQLAKESEAIYGTA